MSASLIGSPRIHKNARILLAIFYLLLIGGGLTMVYPFWLMLTGSVSDVFDFKNRSLLPLYLVDRNELFAKFLAERYGDPSRVAHVYEIDGVIRASDLQGRLRAPAEQPAPAPVADWREFLQKHASRTYLDLANRRRAESLYQDFLRERFGDHAPARSVVPDWKRLAPVDRLNAVYRIAEQDIAFVQLPPWQVGRVTTGSRDPIYADYGEFLAAIPAENLLPLSGAFLWREWLKKQVAAGNLPSDTRFSVAGPANSRLRPLWDHFLATGWPAGLKRDGRMICIETEWPEFLRAKYGTDAALAAAWGDASATIDHAPLLDREEDAALFVGRENALRFDMLLANYRIVWNFLIRKSDAALNTVILVGLSMLAALILNPLAAYALSRYPGKGGRMTLLVFILTIAFPAEVAMIPSFLLLRDFNLLNTFAALVLPGAASGFSIFLLKGFFDGLPEELFESARLDGAGDEKTFWHIALPLSAPILAVTALGSFTAAYSGYMWALLVCQDARMWTLMVWLFQFQMNYASQPWLGMAAFVIASIPTLLVFVFCQRLILRGIVIPTEK